MDPIIGSAIVSAGASLLGGLFGNNSAKKQQKQQIAYDREVRAYNEPVNVRARAEAAGFNPLLFAGPGVGQASNGVQFSSNNFMGQAIADAGLMAADGMRRKAAETSQIAQLQAQNKELQKKLVNQTLRPQMGGIYQAGGPSIKPPPASPIISDYVVPSGGGVAPTAGGLAVGRARALQWGEVLPTKDYYDPLVGRQVEVTPAKNMAGVHIQQGPHTLGVPVTVMGEEAEMDDPIAAAWFYSQALPQIGHHGLKQLGKRLRDTSKYRNELTGRAPKLRNEWDAIDGTFPFRPPGYNAARGY